ncbi:hypothetical protein [Enterobacter cloacae]|uniref:hypothetical protein n=1 Tax=Enterobacter cloacae TaxID=550 RepID=UPI0033588BD0
MSGKRYPEEFKTEAVKQVVDRAHSTLNYQTPSEFAAGWRKGHSENEDSDVTN